jgi:hypothetical protein
MKVLEYASHPQPKNPPETNQLIHSQASLLLVQVFKLRGERIQKKED